MFKRNLFIVLVISASPLAQAADLNRASQAELETLRGMGPSMSDQVLAERQVRPFKDWPDFLKRVKGAGPAKAAQWSQEGLTVGGQAYGPPSHLRVKDKK